MKLITRLQRLVVRRDSARVLNLKLFDKGSVARNTRVCIIPFGVFLKLWASGQSDAFLLLLL